MLLFASYHYSERTRVTDWWRKTPDKSFLSTSVFVAFLLSYSLTLRQLRSYSLTWGSCSYSVTSNNRKRLLKIAQCEPGLRWWGWSHPFGISPVNRMVRCVYRAIPSKFIIHNKIVSRKKKSWLKTFWLVDYYDCFFVSYLNSWTCFWRHPFTAEDSLVINL